MPPLYLTFALMTCCFSSISSARVILSLNALELGATPSAVGLLVATFYTFPLLLSWPVGVLSDRLGSRWLLFGGAACGACGMLAPVFFRSLAALYVAGFAIGFAFTFYNVLLQNLVGQLEYDTIYHEHLSYLSLRPLVPFFRKFGMEVFDVEQLQFVGHDRKVSEPQDRVDGLAVGDGMLPFGDDVVGGGGLGAAIQYCRLSDRGVSGCTGTRDYRLAAAGVRRCR